MFQFLRRKLPGMIDHVFVGAVARDVAIELGGFLLELQSLFQQLTGRRLVAQRLVGSRLGRLQVGPIEIPGV